MEYRRLVRQEFRLADNAITTLLPERNAPRLAENVVMTRPNIICILTDQQHGDCLSIAGHPVVETANLDILALR